VHDTILNTIATTAATGWSRIQCLVEFTVAYFVLLQIMSRPIIPRRFTISEYLQAMWAPRKEPTRAHVDSNESECAS